MKKCIGEVFLGQDGREVGIAAIARAEVVLLLFSAAWCPPCRGFMAVFKKFYTEANRHPRRAVQKLEAIYVSCDESEAEFVDHFNDIVCPCIPYGDKRNEVLKELLEVSAIPAVFLLKKNWTVDTRPLRPLIQTEGVKCLSQLKALSKPYHTLTPLGCKHSTSQRPRPSTSEPTSISS